MSTSIESLGHPLVYKAQENAPRPPGLMTDGIVIRTAVRALTGMQKEALVYYGPTQTVWRMVSDEGPYLNGTDLAPFPLAFYTTGMALSFTDELLKHAQTNGVTITHYRLTQDNFYTMEGSALRGDMIGGALPAEMKVAIESAAAPALVQKIVQLAEQTSPPQLYMNEQLQNTFSLEHNGVATAVPQLPPSPQPTPTHPRAQFNTAVPLPDDCYLPNIITKQSAAELLFNVEGGAGSSLQATQKRTLHVRGICTLRDDGLKEVQVQLFKPIGSTFRFLSDSEATERAPSALAYLAAGIGFCYMTQIGRYAHIVKQDLHSYAIVQDTVYENTADHATAHPVDTHTYLQTGEADEAAQRTIYMSERTCFLHAAMRSSNRTKIVIT